MSTLIFIEPSTQTVTNIITSFIATVTNIQLFTSANISVNLYNADPQLIKTVDLPLVGTDYDNWANNDQYIIDYVTTKLGFVVAPNPPEPPVDPVDPVNPEDPSQSN